MRLGPPDWRPQVTWLLLLGVASLVVAGLSHRLLGLHLQPQGALAWWMVLCLAPVVEEWAFRANLLPELTHGLERWWPRLAPWVANALVSLLFVGVHHGLAGSQAGWWFIPSWVLGMVWFKFRRMSVCVLVHAWFNASLALVSVGGPVSAFAQSTDMPCTTETPAVLSARTAQADRHLQAMVQTTPTGQWVLVVVNEATAADAPMRTPPGQCLRNERLLGSSRSDPMPTLVFEGHELHLQWFRPATSSQARSEVHRMVLDGSQADWPMVRYEHEVSSLSETRGVRADLRTHHAQWHHDAPASGRNTVSGALKASPPPSMVDLPHHTAFALRPKVPRVHQDPGNQ